MAVVASERIRRGLSARRSERREADKRLTQKCMLKCVRHRDIRFPIDRATKHTCRAELFFAAGHLCIAAH